MQIAQLGLMVRVLFFKVMGWWDENLKVYKGLSNLQNGLSFHSTHGQIDIGPLANFPNGSYENRARNGPRHSNDTC